MNAKRTLGTDPVTRRRWPSRERLPAGTPIIDRGFARMGWNRCARWVSFLCILVLLAVVEIARGQIGAAQPASYASVRIHNVPHVHQKPDFCGEACAEMFLAKLGSNIDQDFVFDQSGLDPIQGRGCYAPELATSLRRIGFLIGPGWYQVSPSAHRGQLEGLFRAMHADLVRGVPSVICMHYDDSPNTTEHFRLVLGYDAATDEVIYHEPAVRRGAYQRMKRKRFLQLWPLKYEANQWTVIRLRLEPGRLANGHRSRSLTDADYAQHVLQLQRKLGQLKQQQTKLKRLRDEEIEAEAKKVEKAKEEGEEYEPKKLVPRVVSDFHVTIEKPFVVVGDDDPASVNAWAQGTIRWAVHRLKSQFFPNDPDHVINIWLFKDQQSYRQNVYDLFNRRPHTPFGYYSAWHRALVMNIDTGGGTLVHEIVHPLMAANFQKCPSWLNEGMGSLYEQCSDNNGYIWGLPNWRLRGLQKLIEDEEYEMPTFEELCSTTTREFYDEDPGSNYAQSRYLCYYLQQHGMLTKYYHEFHRSVEDDPTGFKTLQRVLDEEDMEAFQKKWTEFVLELRY